MLPEIGLRLPAVLGEQNAVPFKDDIASRNATTTYIHRQYVLHGTGGRSEASDRLPRALMSSNGYL